MPILTGMGAFPTTFLNNATSKCGAGNTIRYGNSPWGPGNGWVNDGCGTLRVCDWETISGTAFSAPCATVVAAPAPAAAAQYMAIEFTALDTASCVSLASKLTPSSPVSGLSDIYVNKCSAGQGKTHNVANTACTVGATAGIPVAISFAQTQCAAIVPATIDVIYSLRGF